MQTPRWLVRFDNASLEFARKNSAGLLRITLGVVFLWFGALKIFGVSPAAELVAKTLFFLPAHVAVMGMGIVELLIGVGLLTGFAMRVTLLLFFAQMAGTFLTMIVRPDLTFVDGNLLKLTTNGEFIIKNLVLMSAGLAILATVRRARVASNIPDVLAEKANSAR
ncbi:MAG: DoxX family protein [Candidatus Eremiobacteraeota bacterium]|nr:DoxX family protein [Candidatus Eremiobacteraeota bacterium]